MTGMISDCRYLSLAYSVIQVLILYASPILILSIIYTIYTTGRTPRPMTNSLQTCLYSLVCFKVTCLLLLLFLKSYLWCSTGTHTVIKEILKYYKEMTVEQNNRQTYSLQTKRMIESNSSLLNIHRHFLSTLHISISFMTSTLICSSGEILYIHVCLFQIILAGLNCRLNILLTWSYNAAIVLVS